MSDVGHDLRDAECFGRWVDTLPADLASVLRQTSMTYFEFDDAISVVVPHALGLILHEADVSADSNSRSQRTMTETEAGGFPEGVGR